jgi:hypothetical protein
MTHVDYLHAGALQDATEDIDGCIMAVEKRGGRDHPDMVPGLIDVNIGAHAPSLIKVLWLRPIGFVQLASGTGIKEDSGKNPG